MLCNYLGQIVFEVAVLVVDVSELVSVGSAGASCPQLACVQR